MLLIVLLASGKKIARYIKNPRFLQQKIENVTIALNFVEKLLDVKMVGCNAKGIVSLLRFALYALLLQILRMVTSNKLWR